MHEEDNALRAIGSDIKIAHMVCLSKAKQYDYLQQHICDKSSLHFSIKLKITDSPHKLLCTFLNRF